MNMVKKKLYLISPKYINYIGGVETHAWGFTNYFSNNDHFELKGIICRKEAKGSVPCERSIERIDDSKSYIDGNLVYDVLTSNLDTDFELICNIIENDSVVFINHTSWLPISKLLKKKFPKIKIIVRSGGNDILAGWIGHEKDMTNNLVENRKQLVKIINTYVDKLIVNSKFSKSRYEWIGIDENKMIIASGGVDTKLFVPTEKNSDTLNILTCARLVDFKGIDRSIKAVYRLSKKYSNLKYTILGDGKLRDELQQLIDRLEMTDKIIITGAKTHEETSKYYQNADIYLQLSVYVERIERGSSYTHTDTMGRTFCEASSCGNAIIASRVGGIPEMVTDQKTGLLVDPDNEEDIDQALNYFLDKKIRQKFGEKARKKAVLSFDWKTLFELYENIMA